MAGTERKMRSISADFVRFEKVGDVIAGTIVSRDVVDFDGRPAGRYTVLTDDGEQVAFLGTTVVDRALKDVDDGEYVEVEFTGETKTNKGQPLRLFDVRVEDNS